jgi:acetyl esterase/lipase
MPTFHSTNPLVTDIDPDVLGAQRQANALLAGFPHPDVRTPEGLATLRTLTANNDQGTIVTPRDRTIQTDAGANRLRTFVPDAPIRGVMLRIHGGGWAAGAPEDDDTLNDRYARACGLVVVSPEYRLTPDVTVLEQITECVAVAEWLAANAAAELGCDRLLIGGISAGAHLAAATLLRLRGESAATFARFVAAVLDSGPYDLGFTASAHLANEETLVVTGTWLEGFRDLALPGGSIDEWRAPDVSPLLNELTGMPPALFTVGNLDPLRDESILMALRWQLDGGRADLDVWPEGAHAFANMATPLGELAAERTTSWITATLDAAALARARAGSRLGRSMLGADAENETRQERNIAVVRRFIDGWVNGGDAAVRHQRRLTT